MSARQLQAAGLRRFEMCPPGYNILNASLGCGAFACVFLVQNKNTGNLQAMKRVDRQRMQKLFKFSEEQVAHLVEQEFRHLRSSDHPHVVKLLEFHQDKQYSYFIMEAANGGSLRMLVDRRYGRRRGDTAQRPLTETYVADVLHQSLYALEHLHRDLRIHKDVKLENLMLLSPEGRPHVVLIDLGTTEVLSEGEVPAPAGTAYTMAPEVIDAFLNRRPGFDERCDVYSLGAVAELLAGRAACEPVHRGGFAYGPVDYEATRERMRAQDPEAALLAAGRSQGVADLVRRMLSLDPEQRPSAIECMRHNWLLEHAERRRQRTARADGRRAMGGPAEAGPRAELLAGREVLWERRKAIATTLLEFSQKSEDQRMAAYHLCKHHVPVSQLPRVSEAFRRINRSLEGEISYEELTDELAEVLHLDEDEARRVAASVDVNGMGSISFAEFTAACVSLRAERAQELLGWVFEALGEAGGQGLGLDEVHAVLERAAGGRLQMADVKEWLKEATAGLENLEGRVLPEALRQKFGRAGGATEDDPASAAS
eukprot:CAMPEP_0168498868 /NCGR_PEP_ID=MMETSP0228-20121227/73494_1 /TAXON_ID=133427 /ORGANISM="Protoceratium reticulatum, Strain CCCM 535 (=CCMP 1889)" /LENGTH=539 /DNA_ID=CAMNT_0008515771 /DNA_START=1 /DNA_END=1620 /DNA_ORIENTATION=-